MPTSAAGFAKGLPAPLAQLSVALLGHHGQRADIVKAADPAVAGILDTVERYILALVEEEKTAAYAMRDALNAADEALPTDDKRLIIHGTDTAVPFRNRVMVLEFADLAFRWTDDLQARIDTLQTLAVALGKLRAAEAALAEAVRQGATDTAPELKAVSDNAAAAVREIQALRQRSAGRCRQ